MAKIACCHNCAYSYWDPEHTVQCMSLGVMNWPACANHPESLGRMRRAPQRGICPNYRPRLATPEGDVRQIPLGDGYYAYVDAVDYPWLSRWTWTMSGGYAVRIERGTRIRMHRQIMRPPKGRIVDHKNRNKLDNTRANLQVSTHSENARNRAKRRGTSSRFRGVSRHKNYDKYYAAVSYQGEQVFLGLYTDEIEAARARDYRAVELFGDEAQVNFPEEWPAERRAEVYAQGESVRRELGRRAGKKVGGKERKTSKRSRPRRTGSKSRRS